MPDETPSQPKVIVKEHDKGGPNATSAVATEPDMGSGFIQTAVTPGRIAAPVEIVDWIIEEVRALANLRKKVLGDRESGPVLRLHVYLDHLPEDEIIKLIPSSNREIIEILESL